MDNLGKCENMNDVDGELSNEEEEKENVNLRWVVYTLMFLINKRNLKLIWKQNIVIYFIRLFSP